MCYSPTRFPFQSQSITIRDHLEELLHREVHYLSSFNGMIVVVLSEQNGGGQAVIWHCGAELREREGDECSQATRKETNVDKGDYFFRLRPASGRAFC